MEGVVELWHLLIAIGGIVLAAVYGHAQMLFNIKTNNAKADRAHERLDEFKKEYDEKIHSLERKTEINLNNVEFKFEKRMSAIEEKIDKIMVALTRLETIVLNGRKENKND